MARAFLVVMDSVGIGGAPDAHTFFNGAVPDSGANTIGHIAQACAEGRADDGRRGHLHVPHMMAMGLGRAVELASGLRVHGWDRPLTGTWGAATEVSRGKDTPSGHWELAGLPVPWAWHYFDDVTNFGKLSCAGHCNYRETGRAAHRQRLTNLLYFSG